MVKVECNSNNVHQTHVSFKQAKCTGTHSFGEIPIFYESLLCLM